MKLFAVIYLKGQIAAAMFLWPGATIPDCRKVNSEYAKSISSAPIIKSGKLKLSDIKLTCEFHQDNPIKNGVK